MQSHLELVGAILVVVALAHATFPRYLRWKTELASLSLLNRQVMKIHSFFIALALVLMGVLCLTSADELVGTVLGRRVSLGLGIFWAARLVAQLFWYSRELWRGKRIETAIHALLTLLWIYCSVVFLWVGSSR